MAEKKASDMKEQGIVPSDLRFVESIFEENGWDTSKLAFKWNTAKNQVEAYEIDTAEGVLRAIYPEGDWWKTIKEVVR